MTKDTNSVLHVAFATMDGQIYTKDHFGSANIYAVYSYDGSIFQHLEDIRNTTEEEEEDGDLRKARSVLDLLREKNVHIVVARRFGPNIRRIRRFLVPVVTGARNVSNTLPALTAAWEQISVVCNQSPEKRWHVVIGAGETESPENNEKVSAKVDEDSCCGCSRCVPTCPVDAIKVERKRAEIDEESCVGCGVCVSTCPFDAIELLKL